MEREKSGSKAISSLREKLKRYFKARTALLLIMVAGFVLRLPGLDRDLSLDEALSLFRARGADVLPQIIPNGPEFTSHLFTQDGEWRKTLLAIRGEHDPPFYFLLLRFWIEIFGDSNQTLRLLSVIFGVATILVIFLLGRKVFDEGAGLLAASVLAILPLHIQYSQEVRAYPLAVLVTALATYAYWQAYRSIGKRQERGAWLLYAGLAAASLLTHYLTAWILLAHGLFALLQPPPIRLVLVKRLALAAAVSLLLLAPWLLSPYFRELIQLDPMIKGFWREETLTRIPALMFYFFAGWLPGVKFKSVLGFILFTLYATSAVAVIPLARRREDQPAFLFTCLLLLTPILSVIGISAVLDKAGFITQPRFILPALTGLCLLLAQEIVVSRPRVLSLLLATLTVVAFLHFQVRWNQLNADPSTPWWFYGTVSPAVAEVNRMAQAGELILFDDGGLLLIWNAYQKAPLPQLLMDTRTFSHHEPMDFDSKWREVESKYRGTFLVRPAGEPPSEVLERLEVHYRLISSERSGGLEIRHYIK